MPAAGLLAKMGKAPVGPRPRLLPEGSRQSREAGAARPLTGKERG